MGAEKTVAPGKQRQRKLWKMAAFVLAIVCGAIIGWQFGYTHLVSTGSRWFKSERQVSSLQSDGDEPGYNSSTPLPPPVQAQVVPEPVQEQPVDRNKRSWGYTVRMNQPPVVPVAVEQMLGKYGAIYRGKMQGKQIALTFDLGYENGHTEKIVEILAKHHVQATFFATGDWLSDPKNVKLAQRMVSNGHTVGNHTYSHPSLPSLTRQELKHETSQVEQQLQAAGIPRSRFVRPPMGEYSEETLKILREEGYTTVFWSVALRDWVPLPGGPKEYYQTVMKQVHPGAIVLLHAVSPDLLPVLDQLIIDLQVQGYQFVGLDELKT